MTVEVEHRLEGWRATVTDGVWSSEAPGVADFLQSVTDGAPGYIPDDEWTLAVIASASFPNLRIVTERPEVVIDPGGVY